MKREIQSILQKHPAVNEVYGFGSFFRNQPFNDIDLLFVLRCDESLLLVVCKEMVSLISDVSKELEVTLHVLMLTEREFREAPLRDMHELLPLSQMDGTSAPKGAVDNKA